MPPRPLFLILLWLALLPALPAQDLDDPPPDERPGEVIEEAGDEDPDAEEPGDSQLDVAFARFRQGTTDLLTLAEVLPLLADPERRAIIRGILIDTADPPRADLVALLDHPTLAVRLAALELLEELAGGDFSYNPWTPAGSPENVGALARWTQWAGEPHDRTPGGALFSEEQRRSYLQDILGEDRDKAARARRMLEAEGLSAVGFLETFLQETATLTTGHRARIREAQYQITLSRQLGDQASVTARHLAFGSRDQLLSALATVRSAGLLALPILRDFITHADPLVRETAVDSLLLTGGEPAVAIVAPVLASEPDVNVIHGALRRLKEVPGPATLELAASFLSHPDEDLLISAIQTCLSLSGDNSDRFPGMSDTRKRASPADAPVVAALADPRWRVRATALEYVAKRRTAEAKDACIGLLGDPDEFVRYAAIRAIGALGASEALPKLKAMFAADPSMAGPVIEGYGALRRQPEPDLLAMLDAAPVEARLAVLRAIESSSTLAPIALRYATNEDLDVACAALRFIATKSELTEQARFASVLVTALRSGVPEKVEAVMERLTLPSVSGSDARTMALMEIEEEETGPTSLDPLYDAFLGPSMETAGPMVETIPAARAELIKELLTRITPESNPVDRFRAAVNLARSGQAGGFEALARDLPTLTTAQKIAAAEALYQPFTAEARSFLQALIRDPLPEVRAAAAESALSVSESRSFSQLILDELVRDEGVLAPTEVYGYRFESVVRSQKSSPGFRQWSIDVLERGDDHPVPLRVLALIATRESDSPATLEAVRKQTVAADPLLRRAAWNALLAIRPVELPASAAAIAADDSAFVRATLPARVIGRSGEWSHRFSDAEAKSDARWTYNESPPRITPEVTAVLAKLATEDPAPLVRFEASFALLTLGSPIDLDGLVALMPGLPPDIQAARRVTRWLSGNAARATPALRPLIAVIDPTVIRPAELQTLTNRINPQRREAGFATFASLADVAVAAREDAGQPLFIDEPAEDLPAERDSLAIIYFYRPGCPECVRAKQDLDTLRSSFELMRITEYNMGEASSIVLNQALCERFAVPSVQRGLSPAIFTQRGALVRNDINPVSLAELFGGTMRLAQDDSWMTIEEVELTAAAAEVTGQFKALTLSIVVVAGLLDGINPCAFATIIFFLSYLQIARRTPREMLMVGAAFISAVFLAYLAAGLVLYELLAALNDRFAGIQRWMNYSFASLALVAAWLSFRDAARARGGRLDEMTLQLPSFLKTRIRGVIRTGAKARRFVIAAFISGIIISLLELACTGQVYAPIIYQIQQGNHDAIAWLVTYNLAFVAPLVTIFLLAYGGLRSETLIAFQKRHTTSVKTALGLMFIALALLILFSDKLIGP